MPAESNDIHELLRERRSSRVMDPDRAIPPAWIGLLLEAARWAPSAGNMQPWRYLVFDERVPEALESARACLNPGNQAWALRAPLLMLAVTREVKEDGSKNYAAQHDLGLANENLLLQAIALGLHCRPMAGFDHQKAARSFSIPEGYRPMVMIALGFPGRLEDLPDKVQAKEAVGRRRHPVESFAYHGEWDQAYPGAG